MKPGVSAKIPVAKLSSNHRPSVRGDISRSLFYFSVRYDAPIEEDEENMLRRWHVDDPVDERERKRAAVIEQEQGNSNPFILDSSTVGRISDF